MESKGKSPVMDNDVHLQESKDVEMEDRHDQMDQENEESDNMFSWENFNSHCKKKTKQDGQFEVYCKYCMRIFECQDEDDEEKLEEHIQEEHPQEYAVAQNKMQVTEYASSQSSSLDYSHAKMVEGFVKIVVMYRLPYSFGESCGFYNFIRIVNPEVDKISRKTVKTTLKGMYKNGKKELIKVLADMDGFFISCDVWHDYWENYPGEKFCSWKSYQYIRVTCYWIDENWERQQRVLGFRICEDTIDSKFMLMKEILEEYKLDSKNFAISFDNSRSSCCASIDELQRICQSVFHTKLDCHVLDLCINSCVQDCLKHLEEYISPIKTAVYDIYSDEKVWQEWKKFCKNHDRRPKRFSCMIIPTYWYSTYKLLNDTYEYRELLCEFIIAGNLPGKTINLQNWEFCENLLNVLRISKAAVHTFCGVYNPNSHLFLVEALNIVGELQEAKKNVFLTEAILAMKNQWLNHYKTIPSVYLIAFVFDPRCRLEGLEEYLTVYYDLLNLDHDEQVNVQEKVSEIRTLIYDIFSDISAKQGSSSSSASATDETPLSNELGLGDRMHRQRHKGLRYRKPSSHSELDVYLTKLFEFDESVTGKEFPVLEWWKNHESLFPCLSKMAKQMLGAPVSTSTVKEALWDHLQKNLNERETYLDHDWLEAQVCVADWSRVEFKEQENSSLSEDDDDDSEMETSESEDKIEE